MTHCVDLYRLPPLLPPPPIPAIPPVHHRHHIPACLPARRPHVLKTNKGNAQSLPEIEVVHASLDIAHVNVEGEKVDLQGACQYIATASLLMGHSSLAYRRQGPSAEDFKEVGQSFAVPRLGREDARLHCRGEWRISTRGVGDVVVECDGRSAVVADFQGVLFKV